MGCCLSSRIKADSSPSRCASFVSGSNTKSSIDEVAKSDKLSTPSFTRRLRNSGDALESSNLKIFTFNDLKSATRNFRPDSVLGQGGFGSVFKGWIDERTLTATKPGTGMTIAVKKLNQDGLQGHREWLLIGYSLEDEHRLLVYEFMSKGSLDNHLFRRGHFQQLSWNLRMKIALGAAKGLAFLHSPETKVIYRDLKTSNVLLDSNYDAKLSDFGLAKDGPSESKSYVSTRVMGTHGYAAPEYIATGHLNTKSDVYSFGVVLLELLSGKRAIDTNRPPGQHFLVEWAKPQLSNKRKVLHVFDTRIEGQYSISGAYKAAALTLSCLSLEPKHRPRMGEVVSALEQLQNDKQATRATQTEQVQAGRIADRRGQKPKRSLAGVMRNQNSAYL